jgi:leucine zipper transcription factor-like protein 1
MADAEVQGLVQGLGPEAQDVLQRYFFWAKKKRSLHLKDIEGEWAEFRHASLIDQTYNKADVGDLLTGLLAILKVTVDKDQRETTQAFAEVLRQVFAQAHAAGVALTLDLGTLDNPTHMASVAFLERNVLEGKGALAPLGGVATRAMPSAHPLAPLTAAAAAPPPPPTDAGPSEREKELEGELARMQDKLLRVQQQYTAMMHEKTRLAQDLAAAQSGTDASAADAATRARALEAEAADLKAVVAGKDREIAAAQQQLTGKLADSSQFKTLKKLLAQRTQHVKELRTRLNKYEPDSAATTTLVEDSSSDDD